MWVHISYTADNGTCLTGIARGLPVERIEIDAHAAAHIDLSVFPSMSRAAGRLHSFAADADSRSAISTLHLGRWTLSVDSCKAAVIAGGYRFETRSLPISLAATHRGFTFYLGNPFPRFGF